MVRSFRFFWEVKKSRGQKVQRRWI